MPLETNTQPDTPTPLQELEAFDSHTWEISEELRKKILALPHIAAGHNSARPIEDKELIEDNKFPDKLRQRLEKKLEESRSQLPKLPDQPYHPIIALTFSNGFESSERTNYREMERREVAYIDAETGKRYIYISEDPFDGLTLPDTPAKLSA